VRNSLSNNTQGFTLLEVIIAMSIMFVAFAAILSVQSGSINASARAKQMTVVAMLAKTTMSEVEYKFEGKAFDEVKKEDGGQFKAPYQDYRWTSTIKELKFPSILGGGGGEDKKDGAADAADRIGKLFAKYLSKAIREVNVTIFWKRGTGEQRFDLSTYWVNLNEEFPLSE